MIRGVHIVALVAVLLAAVAVRATEVYTSRYQSLPVQDWVESRPPLAEAANVPSATDLVRGLAQSLPFLVIRDDARPRLPQFGPPAGVQRTMGGVRDAARIVLGSPGAFAPDEVPIQARLDTIVFNRTIRASAWAELIGREMDIHDPDNGLPQSRVAGPDERDAVWVVAPQKTGGIATVIGSRGPVGFVLQVTLLGSSTADAAADRVVLSGRAETVARAAAADWSAWLTEQLRS